MRVAREQTIDCVCHSGRVCACVCQHNTNDVPNDRRHEWDSRMSDCSVTVASSSCDNLGLSVVSVSAAAAMLLASISVRYVFEILWYTRAGNSQCTYAFVVPHYRVGGLHCKRNLCESIELYMYVRGCS